MSRTLNLVDFLLTSGRHLFSMGRFTEALVPLTKLANFRNVPNQVLEELNALRAEIHLQQKDYRTARRLLTAAIGLRPRKAEYHYLMAQAITDDETADLYRARKYFERAVRFDSENADYWVEFGAYLFTIEQPVEALQAVRKAYVHGLAEVEIVGKVAEMLRREGYTDEATTKVRAAYFHHHGAAAFRALWQRHQFELVRLDQEKRRAKPADEEPVILTFVAPKTQGKYLELGQKTIRIDQAETTNEPKKKETAPFRRPPRKG